jgi:thiol-disulfide isomerase/thioredoxin
MNTFKKILAGFLFALALSAGAFAQSSFRSLDGGSVDIQKQHGKVVIIAVGARWVPLSAKQADFTNQLAKKYAGKDVVLFVVSTDSATPQSKNFASDDDLRKFGTLNKLSVPVLRDPDGAVILKRFNIDQIPSFVILDKNGVLVGEPIGGIDPKYDITIPISKTVDRLL